MDKWGQSRIELIRYYLLTMARVSPALLFLLAGCAAVSPPASEPPIHLPEVRPGYVAGYLQPNQLPDSVALVSVPPKAGGEAQAADDAIYRSTRSLRDSPRWKLAARDAELRFPRATEHFSC